MKYYDGEYTKEENIDIIDILPDTDSYDPDVPDFKPYFKEFFEKNEAIDEDDDTPI